MAPRGRRGGRGGESTTAGPSKGDLLIATQLAAMMSQMSANADRISSAFQSQAAASAQMAENMKGIGAGEIVNQLVQVNATLKEVVAGLTSLNATATTAFAGMSNAAGQAAAATEALAEASKKAAESVEKQTSSLDDLKEQLGRTGKDALTGKQKLKALGNYLEKEFPVAAGAALGALSGLKQGFTNVMSLGGAIFSFAGGVAKSLFSIGTSILSIPFKLFKGLVGMAQSGGGGGIPAMTEALNELRKEFGALNGPVASAIQTTAASMKGLEGTGMTALQLFGKAADRLKLVMQVFAEGGPAIRSFSKEFEDNGGAILGYQKALGLSNEELDNIAGIAKASGTTLTKQLNSMSKQALGLGSAFGIDFKIISKGMAKAIADVKNFGHLSMKQVGVAVAYFEKLGVKIESVTGTMDAFSTFDDAAEKVSNLNQVFGTNIDAMKIMNAESPAEKMELLRKEFAKAGIQGEKLTFAQRKLIAANTGIEESAISAAFSSKNQGKSLADIKKEGEKSEKKTLSQAEAMSKLADAMDRVFPQGGGGGTPVTGFFDALKKGFEQGIKQTTTYKALMKNLNLSLIVVGKEGQRLGRGFVEHFPGVKQFLEGLTDIFNPAKFKKLAGGVVDVFIGWFKDLESGKASFPDLMERLKKKFFDFFDSEKGAGQKLMGGFKKIMKAIQVILAGGIQWIMTTVGNLIRNIVDFIKNPQQVAGAGAAKDAAKAYISPIASAFREGWKVLGPALEDLFKIVFDKLVKIVGAQLKKHKWKIALMMFGPALTQAIIGAGTAAIGKAVGTAITNAIAGPAVQAATTSVSTTVIQTMGGGITTAVTTTETAAAAAAPGFFARVSTKWGAASAKFAEKVGPQTIKAFKFAGIAAVVADAAINISDAMHKFKDELQKEGFDPATATIAAGTTGLINTLTFGLLPDGIQKKIAHSVAKLSDTITEQLDKYFGPSLGKQLKARLATQFKIFSSLGDLLKALWKGDQAATNKALVEIAEGLVDNFVLGLEWTFMEFPKLIMQLGVYIWEGFFRLSAKLQKIVAMVFHALEKIPIVGPLFGLMGDLFDKLSSLSTGVANIFGRLQAFLKSVDVFGYFTKAWAGLKQFFSGGEKQGNSFFGKIIGWFQDIVAVIEEPYRLLRKVFNIIFSWDKKKSFMENMKEKWDAIVKEFNDSKDRLGALFEKILTGPKRAWEWIKEKFTFENFKQIALEIKNGFIQGLKDLKNDFVNKFKEPINDIKVFFGIKSPSTLFSGIGGNIVDGFMEKLSSLKEKALKPFKDLVKSIKKIFSLETLGKVFSDVVDGITQRLGKITKFPGFKQFIDLAKKVFRTGSPSKEFIDVGQDVVDGFNLSLNKLPPQADKTFGKVVSSAEKSSKQATSFSSTSSAASSVGDNIGGGPPPPPVDATAALASVKDIGSSAASAASAAVNVSEFNKTIDDLSQALNVTALKFPLVVAGIKAVDAAISKAGAGIDLNKAISSFVDLLKSLNELGDIGIKMHQERIDNKIWELNMAAGDKTSGLSYHLGQVDVYYGPLIQRAAYIPSIFPTSGIAEAITTAVNSLKDLLNAINELGNFGRTMRQERLDNKIYDLNMAAGSEKEGLAFHLSKVPEHFKPVVKSLEKVSDFISKEFKFDSFTKSISTLTSSVQQITTGMQQGLVPLFGLVTVLSDAASKVDAASIESKVNQPIEKTFSVLTTVAENFSKADDKIKATVSKSYTPMVDAITRMIDAIGKIDAAVSGTKSMNIGATLDNFKANFGGALGGSGSHLVKAKDLTIQVNFTVQIDATKIEGAILGAKSSVIKQKVNMAYAALGEARGVVGGNKAAINKANKVEGGVNPISAPNGAWARIANGTEPGIK